KILKAYSSDPNLKKSNASNEVAANTPFVNPLARIEGRVAVVIDRIVDKKIEASNFSGEMTFDDGTMLVSGDLQAMGGDWNLEGKFSFSKGTDLNATLESNQINVKEFFRQADNFDQSTITDKHLSGKLNSKMLMNLHWSEKGVFDKDHMHIYAALSVDNGELNRFKLLENFSKFVKIEDLRNIKFVNLRNLLEIENGKLYIPAMYLQSNAMNLTISGEHSFNNDIDYNIKMNVGEIIMKKFHLFKKSSANNPAKRDGFINAYYHLYGTIDHFAQKSDKAAVMSNFTRSEIRKHKIMNALLTEFNSLPGFEEPTDWVDEGAKVTKTYPSFTASSTSSSTGNIKSDIKSTFQEAKQNLKNPWKATPPKETKKTYKDEEDDKEEYLDFKK
ncbi:MAG TPA: AsmA-like C-terminal region-containing protein, partial [Saprospiraceae bacterium]|nr:AsmA-like C-terminal region-containing protein [Saprospiraceae bacterium]